jgi:glycosyltransferase involved in cell wall biosynthesis
MPLVSVIIPAFNAAKYVQDCITSVLQQTFSDFEILVIDDASSDQTVMLLEQMQDPRLNIISLSENGGVSAARNEGIALAKGEFITFLDADDLWSPDKLALQVQALLDNPKAGVAYSWTYYLDDKTGLKHCIKPRVQGSVHRKLLQKNFIGSIGSNILVRAVAIEKLGGFDATLSYAEDWEFCLRLATQWEFVVVPQPQVTYRQYSGSSSSKFQEIRQALPHTVETLFRSAPDHLQYLKAKAYGLCYQHLADLTLRRAVQRQSFLQALFYFKCSLLAYPSLMLSQRSLILAIKLLILGLFPQRLSARLFQGLSSLVSVRNNVTPSL